MGRQRRFDTCRRPRVRSSRRTRIHDRDSQDPALVVSHGHSGHVGAGNGVRGSLVARWSPSLRVSSRWRAARCPLRGRPRAKWDGRGEAPHRTWRAREPCHRRGTAGTTRRDRNRRTTRLRTEWAVTRYDRGAPLACWRGLVWACLGCFKGRRGRPDHPSATGSAKARPRFKCAATPARA